MTRCLLLTQSGHCLGDPHSRSLLKRVLRARFSQPLNVNVCYWHLADILFVELDVRYSPKPDSNAHD
jgi:hypothetical protein